MGTEVNIPPPSGSALLHTSSYLVIVPALIGSIIVSIFSETQAMSLAQGRTAGEWQGQDLCSGRCFLKALCDRASPPLVCLQITWDSC